MSHLTCIGSCTVLCSSTHRQRGSGASSCRILALYTACDVPSVVTAPAADHSAHDCKQYHRKGPHWSEESSTTLLQASGWQRHSFSSKQMHFQLYKSNAVYVQGLWKGGKPDGPGRYKWRNKNDYDGEWRAGKMHGQGTLRWASGERYDGEWIEGEENGLGVFTWRDGTTYDGFWQSGKKHGIGVCAPAESETCLLMCAPTKCAMQAHACKSPIARDNKRECKLRPIAVQVGRCSCFCCILDLICRVYVWSLVVVMTRQSCLLVSTDSQ